MEIELERKVLSNNSIHLENIDLDCIKCNSPSYSLAEKLRERGYDIAGHAGIRTKKPIHNFIGILKDRKPLQKSFFGIKYKRNQRAINLGKLWFNDEERNADENKTWVLDVYGRKHLSEVTKLINAISKPYKINIKVNLKSEHPKEETYLSDLHK